MTSNHLSQTLMVAEVTSRGSTLSMPCHNQQVVSRVKRQHSEHASSRVNVLRFLVSTLVLATACFSSTAAMPPSLPMASRSIHPPGSPPLLVGCSQCRHNWPSELALGCILILKKVLLSMPSRFHVILQHTTNIYLGVTGKCAQSKLAIRLEVE